MTTGPDCSHYQGSPDFARVGAAGHSFVVLKATESTNFVDPKFAANRVAAHAAGLLVGIYHFARAGNAAAEAAWFVKTVGPLQPGEFLVLDWEVPAADPVGWCRAWLSAVTAAFGVRPLIYMNQSAMNGADWSPVVAADHGLWLAKYDDSQAQPAVAHWPAAAMKQFTDRATVPGVSGPVDLNVFFGTTDQLLAFCAGGDPGGLDMASIDQATAEQLVNQVGQIAAVLGDAYDAGTGDSVGDKIRRIDQALKPIQRYAADGKTIVETAVRQEVADIKTLLLAGGGQSAQVLEQLKPIIADAVKAGMDAGNVDTADSIVDALIARLSGQSKPA